MACEISAGSLRTFGLISIYFTSTCALQQALLESNALRPQSSKMLLRNLGQFSCDLLLSLCISCLAGCELRFELALGFLAGFLSGLSFGIPLALHMLGSGHVSAEGDVRSETEHNTNNDEYPNR